MKPRLSLVALLCLLAASPETVRAREPLHNTIEFWGGVAGWSGENARSFETGGATGATFLFEIGMPIRWGVDLAFARFNSSQLVGKVDEFAGSIVARYRFRPVLGAHPFLGARGGYTRLSADYATFRFEQNGGFGGANVGFEVPLGSRVMLAGTGEAMYYGYSDTTIFLEGISIPSTGGNAWRYWGRLGLSFRWGR